MTLATRRHSLQACGRPDPEAGRFSGIAVTFLFADGRRVEALTDRGGWAGVRLQPATALRTITLALRDDRYAPESFTVAPRHSAVFPFRIDSQGLTPPPFQRMELRIDGAELVPTWPDGDERGRYQRN